MELGSGSVEVRKSSCRGQGRSIENAVTTLLPPSGELSSAFNVGDHRFCVSVAVQRPCEHIPMREAANLEGSGWPPDSATVPPHGNRPANTCRREFR